MKIQVTLFSEAKNYHHTSQLLFEKVAGVPLLLRNILLLKKAGVQGIGVVLPASLAERYQDEIAPALEKRHIHVVLKTFEETIPWETMDTQTKIPANGLVDPKLPAPYYSILLEAPSDIKDAERVLTEKIRLSTPGPVARYFNKKISLPISLQLAKWHIHPNWITLVNMFLGITSGFVVAKGTFESFVLGAFLFQMVSIFDGCDGELAKLTFTNSKFGQYFDTISDNLALVSFFAGLFVAFSKTHPHSFTYTLVSLFSAALVLLFWQMIAFLKKNTHSASLATFNKEYLAKLPRDGNSPLLLKSIQIGKTLMSKDCFSLFFFLSALLGLLEMWVFAATGGLWIANGVLIYLKLRQPSREIASASTGSPSQ